MTGDQVLAVLDRLALADVTAWVDGGWGIDALVGRQTRAHADLDLVVDASAADRAIGLFLADGFSVIRDWRPTAIALRHPDGREIDIHPVEPTPDGGGDQIQRDGGSWHYRPPTTGTIAGRTVACCSVETQIDAHLGYEPQDDDRLDMQLLADTFGVALPPPYART